VINDQWLLKAQINPMKHFFRYVAAGIVVLVFAGAAFVPYAGAQLCSITNNQMDDGVIICRARVRVRGPRIRIRQFASGVINISSSVSTGGNTVVAGEDQNNVNVFSGNATSSINATVLVNTVIVNLGSAATTTATSSVEIFEE